MKKHIAVVAPIGAGKTTLTEFFKDKGFRYYKLTIPIYDECDRLGLDREDRAILQDVGDDLRKKLGLDALAQIAIKKIRNDPSDRFIIDSIRNHNELKLLMSELDDDLLVMTVTAPIEVRYKRIVQRKGQYKEDKKSFEEFKIDDKRDLGIGNAENEQNVQKCIDMAQVSIDNSRTKEEFNKKINRLYNDYFIV